MFISVDVHVDGAGDSWCLRARNHQQPVTHLPSLTRSIRKVKPLGTGHGVMEVCIIS